MRPKPSREACPTHSSPLFPLASPPSPRLTPRSLISLTSPISLTLHRAHIVVAHFTASLNLSYSFHPHPQFEAGAAQRLAEHLPSGLSIISLNLNKHGNTFLQVPT